MDAREFFRKWKPSQTELEKFQSEAREVNPREDWSATWMFAFAEAFAKEQHV